MQRTTKYYQSGISQELPVLRRISYDMRHLLSALISKGYVWCQIGITFPGPTGTHGGTIHERGAQGNADIRSHSDTRISDASGVLKETPKGG